MIDNEVTCGRRLEWPCADAKEQALLAAAAAGYIGASAFAVARNRPRWLPAWVAGLLGWAVIPKFFICTRCENYGKACDFLYGGKYAARLFEKQEKPFGASGYLTEGATLAVFQLLPVVAARRDIKALALYALSGALFQVLLLKFCCIDCVRYARDPWKAKYCPTFKMVERLGLASREVEGGGGD